MALKVSNQMPFELDPLAKILKSSGDYRPDEVTHATLVAPLLVPVNPSQPVSISNGKKSLDEAGLTALFASALDEKVDVKSSKTVDELFSQTLIHWTAGLGVSIDECFVNQAATSLKWPMRSTTVVYTARTDVVPAAKKVLQGAAGAETEFFAALGYTFRPEILGFWFRTESDFDKFREYFRSAMASVMPLLSTNTAKLVSDFDALRLDDLTQAISLRNDDNPGDVERCFPRLLVQALCSFAQAGSADMGVLPFSVKELANPRNVVLVNADRHARATGAEVKREWDAIEQSVSNPLRICPVSSLHNLTAAKRIGDKAKAMAVAAAKSGGSTDGARAGKVVFRQRPVTSLDITKSVLRVLRRMSRVNRSLNSIRNVRPSFARASRRRPDDPNYCGKIVSTQYVPDIHIYLDTSGSITTENYQDTVKSLIGMCKRLNVDLYFSSFSHVLASPVRLRVKDRSINEVWHEFSKIPKVTGGTDFEQVWRAISESPARQKQFSLMITDFEYCPYSRSGDHPRNLYYAPISYPKGNVRAHNRLRSTAQKYVRSMQFIEPAIASRLLGLVL